MTEEENTTATNIIPLTNEDNEPEPSEDDELTIEEEFRGLYADVNKIKDRWMRLAKQKEEEKDKASAQLLRLIAGDIIPIIADVIAASGGAFDEVSGMISDASGLGEDGANLTEDEAVQIYVTLMSNVDAFKRMVDTAPDANVKAALSHLVGLNESTMTMLRDTFGDELQDNATQQMQAAANVAGTTEQK